MPETRAEQRHILVTILGGVGKVKTLDELLLETSDDGVATLNHRADLFRFGVVHA